MFNAQDAIWQRHSVRTYDPRPVDEKTLKVIEAYLASNTIGPLRTPVRFKIIALKDAGQALKQFVSYGNIKGARHFVAGAVKKGDRAMEDFGYSMEKNILYLTALGLGTVWLGGSLNRSRFAQEMDASSDEVIPAITPFGYAADKRAIMDRLIRTVAKSHKRKDFSQLFFEGSLETSLDKASCGAYGEVLEAVRCAPSASNMQPWRIIREKGTDIFHFYMSEHPSNGAIKDIHIQNNDMGIAMCHFELAAIEMGLKGHWEDEKPGNAPSDHKYIISWKAEA